MTHSTKCRGIFGLIAATLITPVVAQEQEPAFLDEITVTSTKRQSTLQEIPVAVSVVQAADLKQSQILDVKDLQFLVPSLQHHAAAVVRQHQLHYPRLRQRR